MDLLATVFFLLQLLIKSLNVRRTKDVNVKKKHLGKLLARNENKIVIPKVEEKKKKLSMKTDHKFNTTNAVYDNG